MSFPSPNIVTIAKKVVGGVSTLITPNADIPGNLMTSRGGLNSTLNVGAAVVIKATPGRLRRVVIIAPGSTSGAFTFCDINSTTGSAATTIWSLAYNATANVQGAVFDLDLPCLTAIALTAVPGGGTPLIAVFWD
jgi:hypothetical protein